MEKVKQLLNCLGSSRIEARTLARGKHNEGVRERNDKRRENFPQTIQGGTEKETERREAWLNYLIGREN